MSATTTLLVAICLLGLPTEAQQPPDYEAELIKYLSNNISNFSPLLKPIKDLRRQMKIRVGCMVTGLVSVDSARQSVKLAVFLQTSWPEERLVWNASQFGNLSVVSRDVSQTWFPVIIIYNGIGDNQLLLPQIPVFLRSMSPNLTLSTAAWRRELEFTCQFDMTRFPLDRHICDVEFFFSDQGHNNKLIRLVDSKPAFNTLGIYKENGEWQMINATSLVEYRKYNVFNSMPPVLLQTYIVRIEIQRVSAYYFMNIITPLLLLTLLQVLVYFVPLESGEKLGFGVTIMLSYTVFLLLLDDIVPKSRATPAIASFVTAAMIVSGVSLLLTLIMMRFHFAAGGARMSACARVVLVRFLGRLLCVSAAGSRVGQQTPSNHCSEVSIKKADVDETDDARTTDQQSEWMVAAHALERLMVVLGVAATAAIIGVFVVKPYI